MSEELGKRITEMLTKKGLSQKELAITIGVTESVISRYIAGTRDPKPETLANIATALHTTSDYLLGIESDVFNHVTAVPIKVFDLASKIGIEVIPYSKYDSKLQDSLIKRSEDGFSVERTDGTWYIFYNDSRNSQRINNTIMHEIGHKILDHTEESELAEKEVNFFAKYALTPPVLIHKLQLQASSQIAEKFDVSIEASKYAWEYYQKWLEFGGFDFTGYEKELLRLFKNIH